MLTRNSTAIAHDIHEQIIVHKRSLFLVGHTNNSGFIQDDEVRSAFLPPLQAVFRKEDIAMSTFTPIFTTYTEEDVAMLEKDREKEAKRKKRTTRARRGVQLPDREPLKTHRSLLNGMGPYGAVRPLPQLDSSSTPAAPVQATSSRRAAAIAAQANINLLAQDLPLPAPPSPLPAAASSSASRSRKLARPSRGISHASPMSAREGSVAMGSETPLMTGTKRALREDSVSETSSPLPRKRGMNGHGGGRGGDSPEPEDSKPVLPARLDELRHASVKPDPAFMSHASPAGGRPAQSLNGTPQRRNPLDATLAPDRLSRGSGSPSSPGKQRRQNDDDDDDSDDNSSGSDSDSEDSEWESRKKRKMSQRQASAPPPPAIPSKPKAHVPEVSLMPEPRHAWLTEQPPEWAQRVVEDYKRNKFPNDLFGVVPKANQPPGTPAEWRIRCHDW